MEIVYTAGTFKVKVSGPSIEVIVRVSYPSSLRTCFRRTKHTKESKRGSCTMLLFSEDSISGLGGQVSSAFPPGRVVRSICRRLTCFCRVNMNDKYNGAFRFSVSGFYVACGFFPAGMSSTLEVLRQDNCLRCRSSPSNGAHVVFLLKEGRLCVLSRLPPARRTIVATLLHDCNDLFMSLAFVSRRLVTHRTRLGVRRMCFTLGGLTTHRVVGFVPHHGVPFVDCAHSQMSNGGMRVPRRM